jgi:hypothetical protein
MKASPWISFGAILLGLWLLASPATFGYTSAPLIWSDLTCGGLLLFLGLVLRSWNSVLPAWGYAAIGLWLGFAPLAFWAPEVGCYLNNTIVGMLCLSLFILMPVFPGQLPDAGPCVPPGWSYNPSSWPQRLPLALATFFAWMFARYMGAYQLGYIDTVWDPFFENGTLDVITSDISQKFPVPDAALGSFAYSLEFISTFGGQRRWRTAPWLVVVFGILAVPLSITSVILIILQPIVVGAWCTLCLLTAFCMLVTIPLSIDEIDAALQFLRSREKPFLKLLFQGGHCRGATDDRRTPSLDKPILSLLRACCWGVTLPWNLALSVLVGVLLMSLPNLFGFEGTMGAIDHIFGALIIVNTFIAMAEATRKSRWINIFFGGALAVTALVTFEMPVIHLIAAVGVGVLAIRRGPILEANNL